MISAPWLCPIRWRSRPLRTSSSTVWRSVSTAGFWPTPALSFTDWTRSPGIVVSELWIPTSRSLTPPCFCSACRSPVCVCASFWMPLTWTVRGPLPGTTSLSDVPGVWVFPSGVMKWPSTAVSGGGRVPASFAASSVSSSPSLGFVLPFSAAWSFWKFSLKRCCHSRSDFAGASAVSGLGQGSGPGPDSPRPRWIRHSGRAAGRGGREAVPLVPERPRRAGRAPRIEGVADRLYGWRG